MFLLSHISIAFQSIQYISIHFCPFSLFSFIQSTVVYFVQCGSLWSLWYISVHLVTFDPCRFTSVNFDFFNQFTVELWSTLVHFGLFQSIWSHSVYYGPLQITSFHLVHYGPFRSTSDHTVHFNLFSSFWSTVVHFGPFNLLQSHSVKAVGSNITLIRSQICCP